MVTLDPSMKTDRDTYLNFPGGEDANLRILFDSIGETDYQIYNKRQAKEHVPHDQIRDRITFYPDDPDWSTPIVHLCVSKYPPEYLRKKILDLRKDPDRINQVVRAQDERREYYKAHPDENPEPRLIKD
ncbi:MAG: hypothetical protein HDQ88_09315 [Clostridia bacterium]|nr:hypothetical protein [Clostridia bacterium]